MPKPAKVVVNEVTVDAVCCSQGVMTASSETGQNHRMQKTHPGSGQGHDQPHSDTHQGLICTSAAPLGWRLKRKAVQGQRAGAAAEPDARNQRAGPGQ